MRSKTTRTFLDLQHGSFKLNGPTLVDYIQVVTPLRSTLTVHGLQTLDGCPVTWTIGRTCSSPGVNEPPSYAQRMATLGWSYADSGDRGKALLQLLTLSFDSLPTG